MSSTLAPGALASDGRLARGISATWLYTASGILFFELLTVIVWLSVAAQAERPPAALLVVASGGLVWCASTVPLLQSYRHRDAQSPIASGLHDLLPLVVALAFGAVAGAMTGSWLLAALPLAQSAALLCWPAGIRLRVVIGVVVVLAGLAAVDSVGAFAADAPAPPWWMLVVYAVLSPLLSVLSLWWWDVLVALDLARASEARLAATQERLRVATDVHDLQGHHLQVIALQLELAERLMPASPDEGMVQLRAARASVDAARQGTRDLATSVRSAPLPDEVANAVDLLRAAGIDATAHVAPGAERAPGDVLGPVIREATTNILKHGGGTWARLALERADGSWRFSASNDPGTPAPAPDSSGLEGMTRRAEEVGGTFTASRGDDAFRIAVSVPEEAR